MLMRVSPAGRGPPRKALLAFCALLGTWWGVLAVALGVHGQQPVCHLTTGYVGAWCMPSVTFEFLARRPARSRWLRLPGFAWLQHMGLAPVRERAGLAIAGVLATLAAARFAL